MHKLLGSGYRADVDAALDLLGKRKLVLAIHDQSFPSLPGEDLGRGSPYQRGGAEFLETVAALGFTGVLLGPQGQTSRINPSPYDGTLFSRSTLAVACHELTTPTWLGLISPQRFQAAVDAKPPAPKNRATYDYAFGAARDLLLDAFDALCGRRRQNDPDATRLMAELDLFSVSERAWLAADTLFYALCLEHGTDAVGEWPQEGEASIDRHLAAPPESLAAAAAARARHLRERHASAIEFYTFGQLIAHRQHAALRRRAGALGLKLYGDLQIGIGAPDRFAAGEIFLDGYLMGAPPSRTNPEGQPWSYAVLDPRKYRGQGGAPGPALGFVLRRFHKMLAEYDGIRLDHPHGLVCPWVYDALQADPLYAVQHGARLFESPGLADHPRLAPLAIARAAQLNPDPHTPRYADQWVTSLDDTQVERYAVLVDAIMGAASACGRAPDDIICEVLSTRPYPLERVMARHHLGRFRVTQKANLDDPSDVYRTENAAAEDWVMVGTHDTAPLWALLETWAKNGNLRRQADYLAWRLVPGPDRQGTAARWAATPAALANAKLADLFACAARQVMVFMSDLLGYDEIYNAPGTVSAANWSLRIPPDYWNDYTAKLSAGMAFDIPRALALALTSRGAEIASTHRELISRLERGMLAYRA
ncbi:MAG: 4-alpha-glucanotransferase [Deltaproteobacteria bacterium]|nr:4-alpha-glucanotransferase [Deltaproteobacteria bacterium]